MRGEKESQPFSEQVAKKAAQQLKVHLSLKRLRYR
jgi:hypothetical protein